MNFYFGSVEESVKHHFNLYVWKYKNQTYLVSYIFQQKTHNLTSLNHFTDHYYYLCAEI